MIRDRLVICIQDNDTKARLLREKDLSLNKAFDVCKSTEITNKQLKSLQHKSKQSNEEFHLHVFKTTKTKKSKKARNQDLPIRAIQLKVQRKRGNAIFVARPNGIQSPPISQLMVSNVEFARRSITSAKCVCQVKITEKRSILQKKQKSMIMIQTNPY